MGRCSASFFAGRRNAIEKKKIGTEALQRVEIVKNGKFVFSTSPNGQNAEFTYLDAAPSQGESWYYVRAIQMDRNQAWSSPSWVKYGGQ